MLLSLPYCRNRNRPNRFRRAFHSTVINTLMTKHEYTNWRHRTHQGWTDHILQKNMDVMGVLKFNNGRYITKLDAMRLWSRYWRKMDRIFFGHATWKKIRIERVCFTEYGKEGNNIHLHFAVRAPIAVEAYCAVANAVWINLDRRTASYAHNHITPFLDALDGAQYTCKSTKAQACDDANDLLSFQNIDLQATLNFDTEAQVTRMINAVPVNQIEQAYTWIEPHLEQARQKQKERQARRQAY